MKFVLSEDLQFFEGAFVILNKVYFDEELPPVIITIQSTPNVYGHFTVNTVWTENIEKRRLREINLGADYLDRPIENVMATLLHEMVHLYCRIKGIQDTSNGNRYHNGKFKTECEKRDLQISQGKYIGWSVTTPKEKFIEVLKENGLYVDLKNFRTGDGLPTVVGGTGGNTGGVPSPPKKKTSTRKYYCPTCGISVRATKDVNIACLDCSNVMIKKE